MNLKTMHDITAVIPAFNEDHTTLAALISGLEAKGAEVIVVDDGSDEAYPGSVMHGFNAGYGGAILTGMRYATRPYILTLDGDGQHSADEALRLYKAFKLIESCDMLVGTRRLRDETPLRYLGRKFLNITASCIACYWLPDLNSGLRIFSRKVALGYREILCRQFSFTTSLTLSMLLDGYKIEWFPVKVYDRSFGKSRVKVIKHGFITLYYILRLGFALRTRTLRAWLRSLCGKTADLHG